VGSVTKSLLMKVLMIVGIYVLALCVVWDWGAYSRLFALLGATTAGGVVALIRKENVLAVALVAAGSLAGGLVSLFFLIMSLSNRGPRFVGGSPDVVLLNVIAVMLAGAIVGGAVAAVIVRLIRHR